jgi:hypothetical protein
MVSAVGISVHGAGGQYPSGGTSVASLEGQIRQDQVQLNDWTTCVSAKTPKGQAAIEKLSGAISADKERIARVLQSHSGAPAGAMEASAPDLRYAKAARSVSTGVAGGSGAVDVWA